jgi:hypothetical protein
VRTFVKILKLIFKRQIDLNYWILTADYTDCSRARAGAAQLGCVVLTGAVDHEQRPRASESVRPF